MTKAKIFLLAGLLSFGFAHLYAANSPKDFFAEGNLAYERGDIDKALESYLALVQKGFESNSLYFNLGNSYYKKGERGNAVLWYERALRLDPRDPDINFNLSLARSHLKEEDSSLLEKIVFFFTQKELGLTVLSLSWIFFGFLGAIFMKWLKRDQWPGLVVWASGTLLLITSIWFGSHLRWEARPWAVVLNPPGEVRNGPGLDYAVGFTIPEGARVIVLNKRPEWSQVGLPQQGLKGWMPTKDVEEITSTTRIS